METFITKAKVAIGIHKDTGTVLEIAEDESGLFAHDVQEYPDLSEVFWNGQELPESSQPVFTQEYVKGREKRTQ